MKKQKVVSQMKGQDKTPEKQLNEVEIGNLPEKELKKMIMKMIQDLVKTMKMQEMFTKDLQEQKADEWYTRRNQSRITEAKEEINDLEGQNGGNHCCITEYRKKDEKKWV